jgi:hypothetical protein
MIPVLKSNQCLTSGLMDSVSFGIKPENLSVIFHILRNQLYSDKILAVIREYSSNAYDAHIANGNVSQPIRITLPVQMNPYFKIRDFGVGLSHEDVKEIYAFYGCSTKRSSNDFVGQLGLGSKSGFAYGDNFVINSFINGAKNSYNAFIDETQVGQIALISSEPTKEPNGVEIIIPVKSGQERYFLDKATEFFKWFPVMPEFVGLNPKIVIPKIIFEGTDWKFYGSGVGSAALMGCVSYPIDIDALDGFDDLERELIRAGVVIKFGIGDVEIAASREALQYSDHTKKNIKIKVKKILTELETVVAAKFTGCTTLWEAACLLNKVDDFGNELYQLRKLFSNKMMWKNQKLSSNYGFHNSDDVRFVRYATRWNHSHGQIKNQGEDSYCVAKSDIVFVENDIHAKNAILNRIVPLVEDSKATSSPIRTVYLINFKDDATKQAWLKNGFDAPIVAYSTLPHKVLSQYPDYAKSKSGGSATAQAKHKVKEFKFNSTKFSRYSNRSNWWESIDVDPETDSGVYLEIYGFNYINVSGSEVHPIELDTVIKSLTEAKLPVPPIIYGFKKSLAQNAGNGSVEKARKNPKMVSLWDYIKNELNKTVQTKNLAQAYVDTSSFKEIVNGDAARWHNKTESIKNITDKSSVFLKWADTMDKMQHHSVAKEINSICQLLSKFNMSLDVKKFTPSFDLKKLAKEMVETYPLLPFVDFPYYSDEQKKRSKLLSDYVNQMDAIKTASVAP